jgi:hypothetical protein
MPTVVTSVSYCPKQLDKDGNEVFSDGPIVPGWYSSRNGVLTHISNEELDAMRTGTIHREGATRSRDPSRDNWRTPKWLMDVLHAEFPMLWDATARSESEWAHGCTDGNEYADALSAGLRWPSDRPVFCNPPFSQMKTWAPAIAAHPGPTVTVCKLAPSTEWLKALIGDTNRTDVPHQTQLIPCDKGMIFSADLLCGVSLWLLPCRVAYEPPLGVKATSPSFDSCVVVRR